jgi:transposase
MALDPAQMTHKELRATLLQVMLGAEETESALRVELAAERRENERLRAEVTVLTDRVERLEKRVEALLAENARLRGGSFPGGKDSLNSSMPPGSDGPIARSARAKKRSLREPSGKKPGGQPGHPGAGLALTVPDEVLQHSPDACRGCGDTLQHVTGDVTFRTQVTDLPEVVVMQVTEHQVVTKQCGCGRVSSGVLPYGIPMVQASYGPHLTHTAAYLHVVQHVPVARCQELLRELFGVNVSTGWIDSAVTRISERLASSMAEVKDHVTGCQVAHFDETAARAAGKDQWVHTATSSCVTHLHVGPGRGTDGITAGGVWAHFSGVAVHDEYGPYFTTGIAGAHGICNAHRVRDLNAASERGDTWSQKMKTLLYDLKGRVEKAQGAGKHTLPARTLQSFQKRYRNIITAAEIEHPLTLCPKKGGRTAQTESRNLLVRFRDREDETLLFATDFRVPFTNNVAERSFRMLKVNQKITGGRRADAGLERLVTIRSVVQTARQQALNVKRVLLDALTVPGYVIPLAPCTTTP